MTLGRGNPAKAAALAVLAALCACGDTAVPPVEDADELACLPAGSGPSFSALPDRAPPPATTTGTVPHQQIGPDSSSISAEPATVT